MRLTDFAEGLYIGQQHFKTKTIELRIPGLQELIRSYGQSAVDIASEGRKISSHIVGLYQSSKDSNSLELLGRSAHASGSKEIVLMAMERYIYTVTFLGPKKKPVPGGIATGRSFIACTQTDAEITFGLDQFLLFTRVSAGRIVTKPLCNSSDVKAMGFVTAALYKVIQDMGMAICALVENDPKNEFMSIRIEDRYTIVNFPLCNDKRCRRKRRREGERNIYILGTNGVGKSLLGNLLSKRESFAAGGTLQQSTVVPQPCELETGDVIWDTPGLFNGTNEASRIEAHLTSVIRLNKYYSGVIFVFTGAFSANQLTKDTLNYAISVLGEGAKTSSLIIVNNISDAPGAVARTYVHMLVENGFRVAEENIFFVNLASPEDDFVSRIRKKVAQFSTREIVVKEKCSMGIIEHIQLPHPGKGERLCPYLTSDTIPEASQKDLERFVMSRNVEMCRWKSWSNVGSTEAISRDVVMFRMHSLPYFLRMLKIGRDKILEERSVLINDRDHFEGWQAWVYTNQLKHSSQRNEKRAFLKFVLRNPCAILEKCSAGGYDYQYSYVPR